jgi:hypothetical protein
MTNEVLMPQWLSAGLMAEMAVVQSLPKGFSQGGSIKTPPNAD